MRQTRDFTEIEPSNAICRARLESRPKLTLQVDRIEHDPDHVSSLPGDGLLLCEPTREDSNHGAQRCGEPGFFTELPMRCRFRRLAPSIPPPGIVHIPLSG